MEKERPKTKKYDANFKYEVIFDIMTNGLSIHAAVRKHWRVELHSDIDKYRPIVRYWLDIYRTKGIAAFMPPKHSKVTEKRKKLPKAKSVKDPELAKVLEENEYLRMENEYLKKLRALILEQELKNLSKHK